MAFVKLECEQNLNADILMYLSLLAFFERVPVRYEIYLYDNLSLPLSLSSRLVTFKQSSH